MLQKSDVIKEICSALLNEDEETAKLLAVREYPFVSQRPVKRRITKVECTKLFIRDGFVDRYSGERLLYPGVIVLLSTLLPDEFPFHPNWKMDSCHVCYWELWPTIDHVIPIARGGKDNEDNWVSTSMLRNSAKANSLLSEIDWKLYPPGNFEDWDGLIHWFVQYVESHEYLLKNIKIKTWNSCAKKCLP